MLKAFSLRGYSCYNGKIYKLKEPITLEKIYQNMN